MSGARLRLKLSLALSFAAFAGALATGLYAVLVDPAAIGFAARAASVAPKAVALAVGLLPLLLLGATALARALARPVEDVADAALRVAQGERAPSPRRGEGREARRISQALGSLRREVDRGPWTDAVLRDAWHDLRGSLAAVRASLELLEDGGLAPADAARFLANASRSSERLDARLEAWLTLVRLGTAALGTESRVSAGALVREAVLGSRALAEACRCDLATGGAGDGGDAALVCDADAISRALANLIENACVATPHGTVRVVCDERAPDRVVIDVVNEPAGIPPAARQTLFRRGRSGGSPRGTGLGLAIARAAAEAHGGSLRFVEWGPPRVRVRLELPR